MPELSRFSGIIVRMFYGEHGRPHFHVAYGEFNAAIDIETGQIIAGGLPKRIRSQVQQWYALHELELLQNWNLARQQQPGRKIQPLE
jgi:hypothetical protein